MLKTFNCGIGLVAVVAADRAEAVAEALRGRGRDRGRIGRVAAGGGVRYTGRL